MTREWSLKCLVYEKSTFNCYKFDSIFEIFAYLWRLNFFNEKSCVEKFVYFLLECFETTYLSLSCVSITFMIYREITLKGLIASRSHPDNYSELHINCAKISGGQYSNTFWFEFSRFGFVYLNEFSAKGRWICIWIARIASVPIFAILLDSKPCSNPAA